MHKNIRHTPIRSQTCPHADTVIIRSKIVSIEIQEGFHGFSSAGSRPVRIIYHVCHQNLTLTRQLHFSMERTVLIFLMIGSAVADGQYMRATPD